MTTNSSSHRPQLSLSLATTLTRDLYGLHVQRCRELESFEDRNFHVEVDTSHTSNTLLHKVCCHGYVLKVLNSEDSRDPDVIGELFLYNKEQQKLLLIMSSSSSSLFLFLLFISNFFMFSYTFLVLPVPPPQHLAPSSPSSLPTFALALRLRRPNPMRKIRGSNPT